MRQVSPQFFNLPIADRQSFGVELAERERMDHEILFRCLKPVETGYHHEFRCMDGTQQSLLNQIMDWVANKLGQENVLQRNAYWFFSSPGIGKTSLAHSICENLDKRNHLAGCNKTNPTYTFFLTINTFSSPYRSFCIPYCFPLLSHDMSSCHHRS